MLGLKISWKKASLGLTNGQNRRSHVIKTYSEHSFKAVTSLLAIDMFNWSWIWSERSEISVSAATAFATTYVTFKQVQS